MRRFSILLLLFALLAGACSSDPTQVVVGSDNSDDSSSDDGTEAVGIDSAPILGATTTTTEVPTTTTATAFTTTTPTTTSVAPSTPAADSGQIEMLGPAMVGTGSWGVLRPLGEPAEDCDPNGVLVFVVDGEIVHAYDELGPIAGVRLFNGTRGQDALVANCEESIDWIAIQGSAVMPENGWPELAESWSQFPADSPIRFEFTSDFVWRGDVFTGYGSDGSRDLFAEDLYAIDPAAQSIDPLVLRVGERSSDIGVGFDLLIPRDWEFSDGTDVFHPESFSRVQVKTALAASDPLPEGDELLTHDPVDLRLWSRPDADGSSYRTGWVEATDWTFLANDGVRVVRHIPRESDTVVIEMFADAGDGSIDTGLPWLILDTVRVYEQ